MYIVLRNKEEQEYLRAKVKYDECKLRVTFLKNNISSIEERIKSLGDCEKEYEQLLEVKVYLINIYGDEEIKNKIVIDKRNMYDEFINNL